MKNSIKLKYGKVLERLLLRPVELSIIISIAFHQDENTGFADKKSVNPEKKALTNLIIWGLVTESDGRLALVDKRVVDITLKRSSKEKRELDAKLLRDVKEIEVPADELKYYQMAIQFNNLFLGNIRSIKGRDNNLVKAKYEKWVTPIRLMINEDKVTIDQLRSVYKFLNRHYFWSSNVQSTSKLREKFQTIHTQSLENGNAKSTKANSARTTGSERKEY